MDALVLVDRIDDFVHNAKPVPFRDQVRVDRDELGELVGELHDRIAEAASRPGARSLVERLEQMVRDARPLPLTSQVRFDKGAFYELLDELRVALSPDRPS